MQIEWTTEMVMLTVVLGVLVLMPMGAIALVVWDLRDARRTEKQMAETHEGWVTLMTEFWASTAQAGGVEPYSDRTQSPKDVGRASG